jgi:hypothetical protein
VRLPSAGTFQVSVSLWRTGANGFENVEGYDLAIESAPLIVRDTDGRQVLDCAIAPDVLKQALLDLGLTKD